MATMSEITETLRQAIRTKKKGRKSRYALWQETGIEQAVLSRFAAGTRGLSIDTIEKLAPALGFEIVLRKKSRKGKKV